MTSLNLSGRMHEEQVAELQRVFGLGVRNQNLIPDLKEVTLVDRDAVIFLARRDGAGTRLRNCPPIYPRIVYARTSRNSQTRILMIPRGYLPGKMSGR